MLYEWQIQAEHMGAEKNKQLYCAYSEESSMNSEYKSVDGSCTNSHWVEFISFCSILIIIQKHPQNQRKIKFNFNNNIYNDTISYPRLINYILLLYVKVINYAEFLAALMVGVVLHSTSV